MLYELRRLRQHLLDLDEVRHGEATEGAALAGTEIADAALAPSDGEQVAHLRDGDLIFVDLDGHLEGPGRELRAHDRDRRLVGGEHTAALVGHPRHRLVDERDEAVAFGADDVGHDGQERGQERGLAGGDLRLALELHVATGVDQAREEIVGREAELAVGAEAQLLFGALFDGDVGDGALARTLAAQELIEHLVGHRVLQHGRKRRREHAILIDTLGHVALRRLGWLKWNIRPKGRSPWKKITCT